MYLNAIERPGGSFAGEDAYLEGIPAIAGLGLLELHQPVTFLVGENGSGKSTLLEAVALAPKPVVHQAEEALPVGLVV